MYSGRGFHRVYKVFLNFLCALVVEWGSYITNCGGVWLVNEVVFAIRLQGGATPNGRFDSFLLQH